MVYVCFYDSTLWAVVALNCVKSKSCARYGQSARERRRCGKTQKGLTILAMLNQHQNQEHVEHCNRIAMWFWLVVSCLPFVFLHVLSPFVLYIIIYIYIHTPWLFNIAMERSTIFKNGKPSINGPSIAWLCYVSHNQRVSSCAAGKETWHAMAICLDNRRLDHHTNKVIPKVTTSPN